MFFRVALRGDLAAGVLVGFFALAVAAFERVETAREPVARADVALEAAVLPFPAFEDRPAFAVVLALLRAVVVFFVDDARAAVFFAVERRPPAVFFAVVLRLVDLPFDEAAFLVERELLFLDEAEDFFVEELLLVPDDLRADEPALFFDPLLLLLLDEEREPVDFLVVAIVLFFLQIYWYRFGFYSATNSKTRAYFFCIKLRHVAVGDMKSMTTETYSQELRFRASQKFPGKQKARCAGRLSAVRMIRFSL